MRIKQILIKNFKRFHELTISNIPQTAKLVVLTGPNGSGKSSLYDAMRVWHYWFSGWGMGEDDYFHKQGTQWSGFNDAVYVEWHGELPNDQRDRRKMLYIRSAYRQDGDFTVQQLQRLPDFLAQPQNQRLADLDSKMPENYQRLASLAVEQLWTKAGNDQTVHSLREDIISRVREPLRAIFPDLELTGLGNPLENGSFFFNKGTSKDFHYKNLSSGEKAALNLILDLAVKTVGFDNTTFCIDEPELHMNSRVQNKLLTQLFAMISGQSQLWIATHSIGMLRRAVELSKEHPGEVCFIDFETIRADERSQLVPSSIDRKYWKKILDIALDDMATLVAPSTIVLCEGQPSGLGISNQTFDATCYRHIFSDTYPDTDFVSVGDSRNVVDPSHPVGRSFRSVLADVVISRVRDRDDLSPQQVAELEQNGVRVLKRRHLESYLLDGEVLDALCTSVGHASKQQEIKDALKIALQHSQQRGNPVDDFKSASGEFYNEVKRLLQLTSGGSDSVVFMRDKLAPLIKPGMKVYSELESEVFG